MQRGFSLTEMAVVLVIVALLIGGMALPMSAQQDIRYTSETQTTLKNIHDAILGFAIAKGRLPCPASAASNGMESFAVGESPASGECSNFFDGFVPAVTLGITPLDSGGFAIDAWGRRIRYVVTDKTIGTTTRAMTRTDGIQSATMSVAASTTLLSVCTTATGITANDCGTATKLADNVPALILSTGKNGAGAGADEQANSTILDSVFVTHDPTPSSVANGEFDDIVIWLPTTTLFNRMVSAGRLP